MSRFGQRLKDLTQQFYNHQITPQLGSLNDLGRGMQRGFAPTSEDARSVLFKYRESLGLDEAPQAAEVASRSGLLSALRDGLTAQGAPDPIGFNDRMLRERLEVGQTILDAKEDINLFQVNLDKALSKARKAEEARLLDRSNGGRSLADIDTARDFASPEAIAKDKASRLTLTKKQEHEVITETAKEVKRRMREQSILKKAGFNIGAAAGDANEDRSRSLYWLLNAPQALTQTTADLVMASASPNLRSMRSIGRLDLKRAVDQGLLRKEGNTPLPYEQRAKLEANGTINTGAQGEADSEWLNFENFKPAKPGIRLKRDPDIKNILGKTDDAVGDTVFGQRRISPSTLAFAGLGGTALATNAGLGLTGTEDTGIPLVGRREGYAAASPDEIDPRKSNNAFFEVGTKYVLSRDGRMLPKSDFMLERPDVSSKQFSEYQNYMFDKELDFNPLDGKANYGIIKYNNDGIHGREVSVLGQTLSENEAGIPLAGALLGMGAAAVVPNLRQIRLKKQRSSWEPVKGKRGAIQRIMGYLPEVRRKRYDKAEDTNPDNPLLKNKTIDNVTQKIEDFFTETNSVTGKRDMDSTKVGGLLAAGTFGGVGIGTLIGLEREDRRRRENFAETMPGVDYDIYKKNANNLIDEKYKLMQSDPDRTEKLADSRAGFSRVSQEQALLNYQQKQQAIVDEIGDLYLRSMAQDGMGKQDWATKKIKAIREERNNKKEKEDELIYPLTTVDAGEPLTYPLAY